MVAILYYYFIASSFSAQKSVAAMSEERLSDGQTRDSVSHECYSPRSKIKTGENIFLAPPTRARRTRDRPHVTCTCLRQPDERNEFYQINLAVTQPTRARQARDGGRDDEAEVRRIILAGETMTRDSREPTIRHSTSTMNVDELSRRNYLASLLPRYYPPNDVYFYCTPIGIDRLP